MKQNLIFKVTGLDHQTHHELCPQCWHEVKLQAEMKWQVCPNCLHYIKPCSLCDHDKADCGNCPLDKQEKPTIKFVGQGKVMRPQITEL